jgi:PadR family transcriptional regulator, regulatory protein AphA
VIEVLLVRENKSLYALLGILSFGPHSGYDIKQRIEQNLSHFWYESYGQIYPNLKKLVDQGWATSRTERGEGKPDRNVYEITQGGRDRLHEWLLAPIDRLPPEKNEMLLKLYFGRNLPLEANIQLIAEHRAMMTEVVGVFQGIEQMLGQGGNRPSPDYGLLSLRYGKKVVEAIVEWCDDSLEMLRMEQDKHEEA